MAAQRYRRFIILSGARTGSQLLAQALHAHPNVVCFREVFNGELETIQYGVEGYDDLSTSDLALREQDPVRFLHERIFRDWPASVQAVGFKFHYTHHWVFPGLLEHLRGDEELAVIHLQRRNTLRRLVSLKLAERTGAWLEESEKAAVTPAKLALAVRRPAMAFRRMRDKLRRTPVFAATSKPRVVITPEEYKEYIVSVAIRQRSHSEVYAGHPMLDVYYVDMVGKWDSTFERVFDFLGVPRTKVEPTLRRQNPEPLRDLIANFDELRAAFAGTPEAVFFDD